MNCFIKGGRSLFCLVFQIGPCSHSNLIHCTDMGVIGVIERGLHRGATGAVQGGDPLLGIKGILLVHHLGSKFANFADNAVVHITE